MSYFDVGHSASRVQDIVEGALPVRRQVRGLGENAKEKADGGLIGSEGGDGLEEGAVVQVGQDPGGGREVGR